MCNLSPNRQRLARGIATPLNPDGVVHIGGEHIYEFFHAVGLRAGYATVGTVIPNPGALPATLMTGIDVNPLKPLLIGGRTSSPFTGSLRYSDAGWRFLYAGTDIATPTATAAQVLALQYTPDGETLYVASGTSPYIQGYLCNNYGVPNLTAHANPGTLPTGAGHCLAVHPAGSHVAIGHTTTPFMSVYPVLSGAFGTKIANPASLPAALVTALEFSPQGTFLATASGTTPFIEVYAFLATPSGGTIGAKCADPGTLPAAGPAGDLGKNIAWSPDGRWLVMGMTSAPYVYMVPFDHATASFGVPVAIHATGAPAASVLCARFSPCGCYVAFGNAAGLFVYLMRTWGTAIPIAYDTAGPAVQVNDIVFSKGGDLIHLALNASPYVATYPMPWSVKDYVQIL